MGTDRRVNITCIRYMSWPVLLSNQVYSTVLVTEEVSTPGQLHHGFLGGATAGAYVKVTDVQGTEGDNVHFSRRWIIVLLPLLALACPVHSPILFHVLGVSRPERSRIPSLCARIHRSIALQQRALQSTKVCQCRELLGAHALSSLVSCAIVLDTAKHAHRDAVRVDIVFLAPACQRRRVTSVGDVLFDRTAVHGEALLRSGTRAANVDNLSGFVIEQDIHKADLDLTLSVHNQSLVPRNTVHESLF